MRQAPPPPQERIHNVNQHKHVRVTVHMAYDRKKVNRKILPVQVPQKVRYAGSGAMGGMA